MKIAVIGTGVMGRNHLRVLRKIADVTEIVISDTDTDNLSRAAQTFSIEKTYTNYVELFEKEKPNAAIIATPPNLHCDIALKAMDLGIHVLIEKPICDSLEDAQRIVDKAASSQCICAVGHIERFNPVISKIKEFLDTELIKDLYIINTHRVGPFPKRLLGHVEGVLIDLAIHDFDIISYFGGNFESVQSQIITSGKQEIYVKALIDLDTGIKASSEFSWVNPNRRRKIEILGDSGMIVGDYFNQEVLFYENSDFQNSKEFDHNFLGAGLINSGKIIKYPIYKQEPLYLQLIHFIESIRGECEVIITAEHALRVLKDALRIRTSSSSP